jgi:beta-glucosidase
MHEGKNDLSTLDTTRFPTDFVWGAATASYQIEGAVHEGGRSPSIWDTFAHTPGKTLHGDTGDIACDHYHRLAEDIELIRDLKIDSYRFSIAWPRVQPDGKGPLNEEGVRFYLELIDRLIAADVVPMPTLYHWDLPQALGDQGGWTSRDTAYRFADYVEMFVEAVGPRVSAWTTLNEPWCSAWLGYGAGQHAPGETDLRAAVSANHHLLLAHGLATNAIRRLGDANVGITLNLAHIRPASDHALDVEAARLAEGNANRMFLDPVFKASYPADMMELYAGATVDIRNEDLATIATPIDFLGVNYYHPSIVGSRSRIEEHRVLGYCVDTTRTANLMDQAANSINLRRPGVAKTTMEWEIEPATLTDLLVNLCNDYGDTPIYITENGMANGDYRRQDGAVADPERIAYLEEHISAVGAAIGAGVPVKGYYVWSLMDNFEWALGYSQRFGLIYIDYPTGERTPKASYYWYRDLIAST